MHIIGELLYQYRSIHGITQQELAEKLSIYESTYFAALNSVTLSRWETGTTEPSLRKKRILLHFLSSQGCFDEEGECYRMIRSRYEALSELLGDVFSKNYQYLIGNLPRWDMSSCKIEHLVESREQKSYLSHIVDIERATNVPGYYQADVEKMIPWVAHSSSFCVIHSCGNQMLGHFMMFKIKNRVAEEIAHHMRSEFSLERWDFCRVDEPGTYYIHALYGRSPHVAGLLNAAAYLHLLKYREHIDNVMIFSTRADGLLLTRDYGIEMVDSGRDDVYGLDWYGMLSPLEDILFSDTVLKLVF